MKKLFLLFVFFLVSIISYSQTNFKWDVVDSVQKTKLQIYSDTKMFIANEWKSAQNVIQNDDKEGGMILIKGTIIVNKLTRNGFLSVDYTFVYTISFLMKDQKYRIVLDDVYCIYMKDHSLNGSNVRELNLKYEETEYPGYSLTWLSKKNYFEFVTELKQELQTIIDDYQKYIILTTNNNW